MKFTELTKEAIQHCESIRGKNSYKGCGKDQKFCGMCRSNTYSYDQLENNIKKMNQYVKENRL